MPTVAAAATAALTAAPTVVISPTLLSPTGSAESAAGADAVCAGIRRATIQALFSVPVGQPYNELPGNGTTYACGFGIGPNVGLTGNAIEIAESDTFLVGRIDNGSASEQYSQAIPLGTMTSVSGVGDQAEYAYSSTIGEPPDIFALKGNVFCSVSLNLSSGAEVGLPASTALGLVKPADAPALAKKEAALCLGVFGQ